MQLQNLERRSLFEGSFDTSCPGVRRCGLVNLLTSMLPDVDTSCPQMSYCPGALLYVMTQLLTFVALACCCSGSGCPLRHLCKPT